MPLLKSLESAVSGTVTPLEKLLDEVPYNEQGLVAAIAQDAATNKVLMLGWMDKTAIKRTLDEGYACYYSRSRQTYWRKGEISGHVQQLVSMHFDCDGDAILLTVKQTGPACHTNRNSCFYLKVHDNQVWVE
ncbi:MAG: phosphoribosyl-AMP cyclohydrolase [Gammaproteobacteria bacterium]|nr:phosphoribosyl-AMP cyclohydrolase [Gammaproteobacteria bacterium]